MTVSIGLLHEYFVCRFIYRYDNAQLAIDLNQGTLFDNAPLLQSCIHKLRRRQNANSTNGFSCIVPNTNAGNCLNVGLGGSLTLALNYWMYYVHLSNLLFLRHFPVETSFFSKIAEYAKRTWSFGCNGNKTVTNGPYSLLLMPDNNVVLTALSHLRLICSSKCIVRNAQCLSRAHQRICTESQYHTVR